MFGLIDINCYGSSANIYVYFISIIGKFLSLGQRDQSILAFNKEMVNIDVYNFCEPDWRFRCYFYPDDRLAISVTPIIAPYQVL